MTTFNRENLPVGTPLMDRRVRIVTPYPSLSTEEIARITGRTGTCKWETPDSDGDIYVEFDEALDYGRTSSYVREWEFLDGDTEPVVMSPLTSSDRAVLPKTTAEIRLEALIDAVYEAANRHGYRQFLAGVMEEAGIPLRDSERRLTLRGQRVVSPYDNTQVAEALDRLRIGEKDATTQVLVNRVVAEFTVSVPWPETGPHDDCDDLNNLMLDDWTQIPDDVLTKAALAVGLRGNVETLRTHLTNQHKIAPAYGAAVSCSYCG